MSVLANLPTVSELLESAPLKQLIARVNRNVVISRARRFLDDMKAQVQSATAAVHVPSAGELAQRVAEWIAAQEQAGLQSVINATGIVIHPRLGCVPLADDALSAITASGRRYANIDFDLSSGGRAERLACIQGLLSQLTGSESAIVVQGLASGALSALAALAKGRDVVMSRGQLGELADDLGLPEIVAASGAILREVGTTNVTRISDYAAAMTSDTAALVRARSSRFSQVGRVEEPALAELVALGRKRDVPVIDILDIGGLINPARYGIRGETTVRDSIREGADLVLLRGDGLLGGPACGILVGRRQHVEPIGQHPLLRALLAGKLTLSALGATLRLYQDDELAERSVPVLSLLSTPVANLQHRADRIAPQLAATGVASVTIAPSQTSLQEDALADQSLPTIVLRLRPTDSSAAALAAALRTGSPAVVGRVEHDELVLDLRSVQPRDDAELVNAVTAQQAVLGDGPQVLSA